VNARYAVPAAEPQAERSSLEDTVERFRRDGLVVVRGLLPDTERDALRAAAFAGLEAARARGAVMHVPAFPGVDFLLGDLLAVRELGPWEHLFFGDAVQRVVRALLGVPSPVYWGDSSVQFGSGPRGFHKDNAGRLDASHDDWRGPYGLVRCGLYMQDHDRLSGGLKVRVGSHDAPDHSSGRIIDVDSRFGDLVFWNLRLTHSGNARRLRAAPKVALHPALESRLPTWMVCPEPARRVAAFCTFGAPGVHLERYMDYLERRRDDYLPYFLHARRPDEAVPLLGRAGIAFRAPVAGYGERDRP
jgi:hypothetical protein